MTPTKHAAAEYKPRLVHLFYLMALAGASLAFMGWVGLVFSGIVLCGWLYVFAHPGHRGWAFLHMVFVVPIVSCVVGLPLIPPLTQGRSEARMMSCSNNLKVLAIGVAQYHVDYDALPPAVVLDDNGTPMHSWRALLWPYLWEEQYGPTYDMSVAWDAPKNRPLHTLPIDDLLCPAYNGTAALTTYYAVTGERTLWPADRSINLHTIPEDARATTIMLIEDHSQQAVWCEPVDLTLDEAIDRLSSEKLTGPHFHPKTPGRWHVVAMANRRVTHIRHGLDRETLLVLFDPHADPAAKKAAFRCATWTPPRREVGWIQVFAFLIVAALPVWWVPNRKRETTSQYKNG